LTPASISQGVDGLVQHGLQGLAGAFGQALAGDEQLRLAPGRREIERGALPFFSGAAFDPVVGAEVAPFGVDVQGARGQAGAGLLLGLWTFAVTLPSLRFVTT
jgi:hypothetical protein